MKILVREALKEELPEIRMQRVSAYEDHRGAIPEEHWQALKTTISSNADQQPGVELLIAEINGDMLGSVALFPAKTDAYEGLVAALDYPEIRVLSVIPQARGIGVASALMEECIHRAKAKGYPAIGLHTGEFMKGAIALYKNFGFVRIPQHDFEPANDGITVMAFQKSL
ncbi:Acetyltransferase (GNAT) family protein [Halobacillus karajensis]|uniref:GNAT family N-acetyltransferase n=1 Tax=Halobacillus karajensis TaxID=195088 RepID=UPI0008A80C0A|nr:GNAT family N-acetyltransferase [Halobacillus karajensis]SEH63114.1 Acetyltransferase (GNAT) family protein [Halobacillus karajensis]